MGTIEWDFAGFTDALGHLGKAVQCDTVNVPHGLSLDSAGEHLIWGHTQEKSKEANPGAGTLDAFIRLWRGTAEDVLRFAKKWGVLHLNKDGRPCRGYALPIDEQWSEPIERWKHFSRRANAVLDIAAALAQGKVGSEDDWASLSAIVLPGLGQQLDERRGGSLFAHWARCGGQEYIAKAAGKRRAVRTERVLLSLEINLWLELGEVRFLVHPIPLEQGIWHLLINQNGSLFSAIALQLALTLANARIFMCSGCGMPYARQKRAPRAGSANFCERCGRDAAVRQADQRRREKMATARRLHEAGKSPQEIAKELKVRSVQSVRRWLK